MPRKLSEITYVLVYIYIYIYYLFFQLIFYFNEQNII